MSQPHDVAARLAQGRPAVQHTQRYVWAAHLHGYQHPDLTCYDGQLLDRYDGEAGLDLRVLDDDCATLWSVVGTAEEVLRLVRVQLGQLAGAWTGPGADAAARFLYRHCEAAGAVIAGVRAAAESCATLGAHLWQLVDVKVASAVEIDDRTRTQRPVWLAAATGATAASTVDEVVNTQIKPYVAADIGTEWLNVMRSTGAAVGASYDAAVDALTAAPPVTFEIPGELGPHYQPTVEQPTVEREAPLYRAPVELAAAPRRPAAVESAAESAPADLLSGLSDGGLGAPLSGMPADSGFTTGATDSGLPDLGRMLAGALAGLLGAAGLDGSTVDQSGWPAVGERPLSDPADPDPADPDPADPADPDPADPRSPDAQEGGDYVTDDEPDRGEPAFAPQPELGGEYVTDDEPDRGEPAAAPQPAPDERAVPPAEPAPCEIAADELPRVGQ